MPSGTIEPVNPCIRKVAICFDDGFRWQRRFVEELGITATFAVPTSYVGLSNRLSWKDLEELADAGHEIAFHGHRHNAWGKDPDFDVDEDVRTSMEAFAAHGHHPCSIVPPFNKWLESEVVRSTFRYGRKGEGPLLPDILRIKACGLSRRSPDELGLALGFNAPRSWEVYVAHLYQDPYRPPDQPDERFVQEAEVVRRVVEGHRAAGAKFVQFAEVAREFEAELHAVKGRCPICGGTDFEAYGGRSGARCSGCRALERHRDLAYLLRSGGLIDKGARTLLVSSGEMLSTLQDLESEVVVVSQHRPAPWNDVLRMPEANDGSFDRILVQHVLPHVSDPDRALREMGRVLSRDGWLLCEHPLSDKPTHPRADGYGVVFGRADWERRIVRAGRKCLPYPALCAA